MSFASGNHPASTPIRTTLATLLTAAGFTQVTANYSPQANWLIDVWKSPAAGNAAGVDWYLIVGDQIAGANRLAQLSVCEGWDDTTKTATKYIPTTNNVAPAADFSVGAGAVAPTSANLFYRNVTSWVDTVGTTYKISATLDRVVVQLAAVTAIYAGHIDKNYSAALDPVALVVTTSGPNGSGTANATDGGTTREPGQTVASSLNFRTMINSQNASQWLLYGAQWGSQADAISGKILLSPVVIICARSSAAGSHRGTMKDLRGLGALITLADTATEVEPDGTTRNLFPIAVGSLASLFAGQL